MAHILDSKYRQIINDCWEDIKKELNKNNVYENKVNNIIIKAQILDQIDFSITIIDGGYLKNEMIPKNAKFITFHLEDGNKKKELIYGESLLLFLSNFYKMQHPIFKKKIDDNTIIDVSLDENTSKEIMDDPDINEIYDDNFSIYINKEEFLYSKEIKIGKVSNFYDESLEINKYSKLIDNDKIITSKERVNIYSLFHIFSKKYQRIFFIIACQNIGMSFSILFYLNFFSSFYLNFEEISLLKSSSKRKYIFRRFFTFFSDYNEYEDFINKKIFDVKGYENILAVIKTFIILINEYIINNKKNKSIYIVLDNYDENLVGTTKLSKDYIDEIYKIIKNSNIKIIILGKGIFINNLFNKYLLTPLDIENYIDIYYFSTLNIGIETRIHEINRNNGINEIDEYFKKKYKENYEEIIFNFILLKNSSNLIKEKPREGLHFQFLKVEKKEENNFNVSFQFEDTIDINNKRIREYLAKINNYNNIFNPRLNYIKGFIIEELLISLFINNKVFDNIKFENENIIEVETIYNMEKEEQRNNIKSGPILLIQKTNGEVFDLGIILNEENIEYLIGIQIGINKRKEEIEDYLEKLNNYKKNILSEANRITNRNISQLGFIIILNKEYQQELYKKYQELSSQIDKLEKDNKNTKITIFKKEEEKKMKSNLSKFNTQFGEICCQNAGIKYFLFSNYDLQLYEDDSKAIKQLDLSKILLIKSGLESFCFKQYHLSFIMEKEKNILNEKEKNGLLDSIKTIDDKINDFQINYEINKELPLLVATPSNTGILSITKTIKVLTYFTGGSFIHFLLNQGNVKRFDHETGVFKLEYNADIIIKRYFVNFIYKKKEDLDSVDEEISDNEGKHYINNLEYLRKKTKRKKC